MRGLSAEDRKPSGGDPCRNFGTATKRDNKRAWLSEARNEKSVTVDLRTPHGAVNFKWLVSDSDVLCESFRPEDLEKRRGATRHRV